MNEPDGKIKGKFRCPKHECREWFDDSESASKHAKDLKHWGDYNILFYTSDVGVVRQKSPEEKSST